MNLWDEIQKAPQLTDSHLRNFETLMQDRKRAWIGYNGGDAAQNELAASLIRHYFPENLWARMKDAYQDGFLSLTLKIYLHILKQKLRDQNDTYKTVGAA